VNPLDELEELKPPLVEPLPHHRLIHRGLRVEVMDGLPMFRRPDGSPLEDRAPP